MFLPGRKPPVRNSITTKELPTTQICDREHVRYETAKIVRVEMTKGKRKGEIQMRKLTKTLPEKHEKFDGKMFSMDGNLYQRIMREEIQPYLEAQRTNPSSSVAQSFHGVDVLQVRTHSMRRFAVCAMQNEFGSDRVVAAVCGMHPNTVPRYDTPNLARKTKAQQLLSPFADGLAKGEPSLVKHRR